MTKDTQLRRAVERAVEYSIKTQHAQFGGWRYVPGDPSGDTSQFGWQVMALKSAERAGISVPKSCIDGMKRFLESVVSGRAKGLASYRPGEPVSRSMTAEALVCRHFLEQFPTQETIDEGLKFLLEQAPGTGPSNHYYWYYGTLAAYQSQGLGWEKWNLALQKELLHTQSDQGDNRGSWPPDNLWGQYGGRVFSTALSAMCLESYYRYAPITIARDPSRRAR
jgi:hypothetical protein